MTLVHLFFSPALLFLACLFSPFIASAHDAVFPAEKLKSMHPGAESFEQRNLYVSDDQRDRIEKDLGGMLTEEDLKPSVYFAVERDPGGKARRTAVLLFIDAEGMGGKMETGIMMSSKGELMKVAVFENNEPDAASSPSFLEQFAGKKSTDPFLIGEDVSPLPGLEKTAQAIASGARRGMLIIHELFRRN